MFWIGYLAGVGTILVLTFLGLLTRIVSIEVIK